MESRSPHVVQVSTVKLEFQMKCDSFEDVWAIPTRENIVGFLETHRCFISCDYHRAGLVMTFDGKPLNRVCGPLWLSMMWIPAIQQLLDGGDCAYVMPFLGYHLKMSLNQQRTRLLLEMGSKKKLAQYYEVPFDQFLEEFFREIVRIRFIGATVIEYLAELTEQDKPVRFWDMLATYVYPALFDREWLPLCAKWKEVSGKEVPVEVGRIVKLAHNLPKCKAYVPRSKSVRLEFRMAGGEDEFVLVEPTREGVTKFVQYHLSHERQCCCSHQGGLYMYCGDELVCDSGMCDEYHMTLSWLPALQSLLGKSRTAKLAPWEESDMELYLIEEGQRLILNDGRWHLNVPFPLFMDEFIREFSVWRQIFGLVHEILREMKEKGEAPAEQIDNLERYFMEVIHFDAEFMPVRQLWEERRSSFIRPPPSATLPFDQSVMGESIPPMESATVVASSTSKPEESERNEDKEGRDPGAAIRAEAVKLEFRLKLPIDRENVTALFQDHQCNDRCTDHKGGLFMCVDGKWLADETLCGNFWYIMTWIPALQQLLDGHVLNSYVMLDFGVQMKLSLTEQRKRLVMQVHDADWHYDVPFRAFMEEFFREFVVIRQMGLVAFEWYTDVLDTSGGKHTLLANFVYPDLFDNEWLPLCAKWKERTGSQIPLPEPFSRPEKKKDGKGKLYIIPCLATAIPKVSTVKLEFRMMLHNGWEVVQPNKEDIARILLNHATHNSRSCCSHQGGLYMYFDGELVADSSRCDEFWMTAFWMEGFKGLLEGSWKASAMPWEESQMKLCFFEDRRRLILKDGRWRYNVPFRAFMDEFFREFSIFRHIHALAHEIMDQNHKYKIPQATLTQLREHYFPLTRFDKHWLPLCKLWHSRTGTAIPIDPPSPLLPQGERSAPKQAGQNTANQGTRGRRRGGK